MKLRIPTITLLFALTVSAASCGDVTDSIVTEATEPQQTSEVVRTPYIEKNDYGGAVFTVFAPEWGQLCRLYVCRGADRRRDE